MKNDVQIFLNHFKEKLGVWGVIFRDDRNKNAQTLLDLEITPLSRESILKSLCVADYSEGPITDTMYSGSDLWVFGKEIKGKEVYIKITLGINGTKTICISFHTAEHKMNFPFKVVEL
jgi:hypothetical protein